MAPRTRRRHELVGHTADIGLRATAADLPALFEEAGLALAEASADVPAGSGGGAETHGLAEVVDLEADDLVGLAFGWLNELIGLAQARGEAVSRTRVSALDETATGWRLRARAVFEPYTDDGGAARARLDVKSATFHRLEVGPADGGWALTAYLDV